MMEMDRCHWLKVDGNVYLVPGCYGAALGSPAECCCGYDEDELVVPQHRASQILERNRGIPGAAQALALALDAVDQVWLSVLLRPLWAALDLANAQHSAALDRWRAARWTDREVQERARAELVEPPWRTAGQIERLVKRLSELAIEPGGTVAQRARRHPHAPSPELLRLLGDRSVRT